MRRDLIAVIALFLAVCALAVSGAWAAQPSQPVTILVAYEDTALPPYYLGETREVPDRPGIGVELLQHLDEAMPEVVFYFKRMPWKRCLYELEVGAVDAAFPASFKEERQRMGAYPRKDGQPDVDRSMINLSYFLYTLRDSGIAYEKGEIVNLHGRRVGAPMGYSVVGDLKAMGVTVDEGGDTLQNLVKLIRYRVPVVAVQDVTADALIEREPKLFADVVKLWPPLKSKPNYLLFSHQFRARHPALAELVWDRFVDVKREFLREIAAKYVE